MPVYASTKGMPTRAMMSMMPRVLGLDAAEKTVTELADSLLAVTRFGKSARPKSITRVAMTTQLEANA